MIVFVAPLGLSLQGHKCYRSVTIIINILFTNHIIIKLHSVKQVDVLLYIGYFMKLWWFCYCTARLWDPVLCVLTVTVVVWCDVTFVLSYRNEHTKPGRVAAVCISNIAVRQPGSVRHEQLWYVYTPPGATFALSWPVSW